MLEDIKSRKYCCTVKAKTSIAMSSAAEKELNINNNILGSHVFTGTETGIALR